jgi:hypothetical protein
MAPRSSTSLNVLAGLSMDLDRGGLEALVEELAHVREDNDALRASARWWRFLYENALTRANACEDALASSAPGQATAE